MRSAEINEIVTGIVILAIGLSLWRLWRSERHSNEQLGWLIITVGLALWLQGSE